MKKITYSVFTILLAGLGFLFAWGIFSRGWFGYDVPKSDAALEQQVEDLLAQLAATETERNEAISERNVAVSARDAAILEKESAEGERDALQASANIINAEIETALNDVYAALAEFYAATGESATVEAGLSLAIDTYGEPSLDSLNPIIADLLTAIENSDGSGEEITYLLEQISNLQGQISTLQGQLQTANNTITSLNGQISTLNNQISTLNTTISNLNGQISALNDEIIEFLSNTFLFQNAATLFLLGTFADMEDAFNYLAGNYPFDFYSAGEMSMEVFLQAVEKMNDLADQSFRICAGVLYDYFADDFGFEDVDAALEFLREEFIPAETEFITFTQIFAMFDFVFTEFESRLWEGFFPAG